MRAPLADVRKDSGFTLVEVLIATALLAIVLTSVLTVFPQAYHTTTNAGRVSVLNHLVSEKMEELRSYALTHADLSNGIHPTQATDSNGDNYYPVPGFGEQYSLRWIVGPGPTDGTGTAEPNMRTVVVQATYMTRYTSGGAALTTDLSLEVRALTYVY